MTTYTLCNTLGNTSLLDAQTIHTNSIYKCFVPPFLHNKKKLKKIYIVKIILRNMLSKSKAFLRIYIGIFLYIKTDYKYSQWVVALCYI